MKKLTKLLIAGTIFLTGCATAYIPERAELNRIKNIPYNENTMKCTHKSIMYHLHLYKNGIDSRVVVGKVRGYPKGHAWVESYNEETGTWHMQDPTWNKFKDDMEIDYYDTRTGRTILE